MSGLSFPSLLSPLAFRGPSIMSVYNAVQQRRSRFSRGGDSDPLHPRKGLGEKLAENSRQQCELFSVSLRHKIDTKLTVPQAHRAVWRR
ncbi:hypothetical protein BaRGS_00003263 [Batillaria attramentaria]|uniref:Uncharacterized protein n=1 Tax=Batillaria attramentaria TaxID=370345 RepID=A0ABD0M2K1_9CAEN